MTREEIAYARGVIDSCELMFSYAHRFRRFQALAMKLVVLSKSMLQEIEQAESWRSMSAAGFSEETMKAFAQIEEGE